MINITVVPAEAAHVTDIAAVLSEATTRKFAHGDYLWGSGGYTTAEVTGMLAAGGLYAVTHNDAVVGTVTLTTTDERVWGEDGRDPDTALYVHKLASSDRVRGRGVGAAVLDWVAGRAATEGRSAVRLDCSHLNTGLYGYYAGLGFTEVGRRSIPRRPGARDLTDPVYEVALMERKVS